MKQLELIAVRVSEVTMAVDTPASQKTEIIQSCIKGFAVDILNAYTNIEATSLNDADKEIRIKDLCTQFCLTNINGKFY